MGPTSPTDVPGGNIGSRGRGGWGKKEREREGKRERGEKEKEKEREKDRDGFQQPSETPVLCTCVYKEPRERETGRLSE